MLFSAMARVRAARHLRVIMNMSGLYDNYTNQLSNYGHINIGSTTF